LWSGSTSRGDVASGTSGERLLPVERVVLDDQEHADVVDAAGDNPGLSPGPGRRALGRGGRR